MTLSKTIIQKAEDAYSATATGLTVSAGASD